jgi:hypothetical protein
VVIVREFVSRCSRLTVKVKTDSSGDSYSPNRSSIFYCGLSRIRPLRRASREKSTNRSACGLTCFQVIFAACSHRSHAGNRNRVRDSRSDAGASALYLSRLHSCQLDRCDQPSYESQSSRRFIRCGGCGQWRKEAVSRQILACVLATLTFHNGIVFNRRDLPRGTLHGRATVTFPHAAQTVCQCL